MLFLKKLYVLDFFKFLSELFQICAPYILMRVGWLGMEGNPPTRDNSSPYKQALRKHTSSVN